jgi:hypothetical protein
MLQKRMKGMTDETDDRKRSHLRLVVSNPDKRSPRPVAGEGDYLPLDELVACKEKIRPHYYQGMERSAMKACLAIERFLNRRGWDYGLDPHHGKPIVVPAVFVSPETTLHSADSRDEVLLFVSDDAAGSGLCLSLEMILPFYSEDESVMEEALLYSPVFQYGTLFLEDNRQDGYLDLIYRLGFPLYPPALTGRILDRLFAIADREVGDALRGLAEYPEPE